MAQLNRNASYFFVVDGLTPWEKLRSIRNFLKDRKLALSINELGIEKMESMDKDSWEYREWFLHKPELDENLQECREEIEFLEKMEAELIKITEPTRINGKTDKEMYEINYFRELAEITVHSVQAEIVADGRISKDSVKSLLRNPFALQRAIELKLITDNSAEVLENARVSALVDSAALGLPAPKDDHAKLSSD